MTEGFAAGIRTETTSSVTMTRTHTPPAIDQQTQARAMRRAVELARAVRGRTSPLPPVGAVVLQGDRVVGEGATAPPGGPHAEVNALAEAGERARGGTLVVTLEPCNHMGRTPPCTEAIQRAGIARVVVGTRDPNPRVAGGGLKALAAGGVATAVGLLDREAEALIAPFATLVTLGRPFVTAKWAMTLDGKIAGPRGGESITGADALAEAHRLRDRVDAVVVGSATARIDDPRLTVRPAPPDGRQPLRVIMDSAASLASDARMLGEAGSTLVMTSRESAADRARLERAGAEVVRVAGGPEGRVELSDALTTLGARGLAHVLVEGGSRLLGALVAADLVDEVVVFIAPRVMGPGVPALDPPPEAGGVLPWTLDEPSVRQLGPDIMLHGQRPAAEGG
ncbi:MAG: bifunctional diaminohydroxyphosphoribosylaminopyrimidine deaminase/5-amino-6-(5-phosphoribosylamino)uracil reductase RibD [Chloroflexi bacterium]|nr:bifunctional diaminohydroxyphosphoribosylaminopyrimidine deaminase/5-amino-6-(5-phosphoribosylamino)uracil reductase RibD [Chloroflexota bacterium]